MSNPFTEIIEKTGKKGYQLLENELKGIVADPTFYSLIDERGIPNKTQWDTVLKVAQALGYEIVFQEVSNE